MQALGLHGGPTWAPHRLGGPREEAGSGGSGGSGWSGVGLSLRKGGRYAPEGGCAGWGPDPID
eukprot:10182759-Alexandrium_andersonii.AAC.1